MENYPLQNRKFSDINPLICGEEVCKPNHSFGPAVREYHLLHYVVSGKGKLVADEKEYSVKAGECFVIFPHEITYYEADENEPWHYIWIGFESGVSLPSVLAERVLFFRKLADIFGRFQMLANMENGREAFLCAQIWEIISLLNSQEKSSSNKMKDYMEQAVSCIENEYMMEISVQEIADRLNLNRSYFSTLFKAYLGVSPHRYLLDFRMKKAAELLVKYGYSVTETALSTGYSDVFTFSKMFKKKFGISPSLYQNQNRR